LMRCHLGKSAISGEAIMITPRKATRNADRL
jgi:hypothetical protein